MAGHSKTGCARVPRKGLALGWVAALCVSALAAQAQHAGHGEGEHDAHAAHRKAAAEAAKKLAESGRVKVEIRDLELLDQHGEKVSFKSDVIGDKLVAMTFIYTTCTTICPVYSALFTKTQELLGERMGKEVVLVTLTLDPTTDVPPRLAREAKRYRAEPGWYFLTGKKQNVDEVLRGLDAYFPDFTQHPPMALVGDGKTGVWKRYNGFPKPDQIVSLLDELKAARQNEAGGR
jgi:protein SCO1/2